MSNDLTAVIGTAIPVAWANDISASIWGAIGTGRNGTPPSVPADVRTNLGFPASSGATLIGFLSNRTGGIARTAASKMQDRLCVFDFFTVAQRTDVIARAALVDVGAAITTALAAVPTGGTLFFPAGTYTYATSPNFGINQIEIEGEGQGTIFNHTGTGSAWVAGTGSLVNYINGMHIRNITIQGNASSTNAMLLDCVGRSVIENVCPTGCATTGAGIKIVFGVSNNLITPRVYTGVSPIPLYGIWLTTHSSGARSTNNLIVGPSCEQGGVGTIGIYLDNADDTTIVGGTSENLGTGVNITGNSNVLVGHFIEGAPTGGIVVTGARNVFTDCFCQASSLAFGASGSQNKVFGGGFDTITTSVASGNNAFYGVSVTTSYTDSSTSSTWVDCFNNNALVAAQIPNKLAGALCGGTLTSVTGATYTVLNTDWGIKADRAGTVTLTLPSPTDYSGRILHIRTVQNQTVVSDMSNVIPKVGGAASTAICAGTAGTSAILMSNAAAWEIVG